MKHILASLVVLALLAGPASARRNDIDGIQYFTVCSGQLLSTSDTTLSYEVPNSKTEGVCAAIQVTGLGASDTVTITRVERANSAETAIGYPLPAHTQQQIVIDSTTANPGEVWQIPVSEGCEYFQFRAKASAGTPRLTIIVGTQ